jgi:hypothetical protein
MDNTHGLCDAGGLLSNLFEMLTESIRAQDFCPSGGCGLQRLEFSNCCIRCDAAGLDFGVDPFRDFTDSLPPLTSL